MERIVARASAVRDLSRPLVWFHAPSVGEGLQARPVVHAMRDADPTLQFAYTFFSPSAERFAESVRADITDYLPFDGVREADALLDAMRPAALVFVKLDVWPTLVARAAARGIPVALLSATVAPESSRLGRASRAITRDAYAALAAVGAISESHGKRLELLGVRRAVVQVTGDTRFDQVWERAAAVDRTSTLLSRLASARPTLVAGSTWPADEAVLLPAWKTVRAAVPNARLIVVPHEPTPSHVDPVVSWGRSAGLETVTLDRALSEGSHADVVVVDQTGVLGELYALADVAFVGGGFHAAGLHSVIEPAAFGAPVTFGPGHRMSREAGLLLEAGGARSVATSAELAMALGAWLGDPPRRASSGALAREVVETGRGATARSVALVRGLWAGA
ncbi:MAG TPA: glycosyltransferase N-terminal domain-containing protein [Gemmatimonas sp.]|nr:glycosyltransferase N-terminal domain-containing protein [Gemmatimonas sp.]